MKIRMKNMTLIIYFINGIYIYYVKKKVAIKCKSKIIQKNYL